MALNTDYRSAAELTAAARAASDTISGGLLLESYLPSQENFTLSYEFDATGLVTIGSAEFRSFDTEAPYGKTQGGITKSGKLPPISKKLPVRELQELQLTNQPDGIGRVLDRYAAQLGQEVAVRAELARGEAITTGKLVLAENGIVATIDYGRSSTHTVTAATLWSATGAKPLDDILSWVQTYTTDTGSAPETLLISRRILADLSKNADFISAAVGSSAAPSRVSFDDVVSTLASYGVPRTVVFDKSYSKGGTNTRVIPDNVAILLPNPGDATVVGGVLGTTQLGVPAEAIQPSYGIPSGEEAGIFAGAFDREDPIGMDVLVSAILLPVLSNANATFAATVL